MKFFRNVLLIVFFLLTIVAASLWAVTYWIKPNTFKTIAQKQLSNLTQQNSTIEGHVSWKLFPKPGLHITNVRIGNPEQTDAVYASLVDHLLLNLQIIPLFQGRLVFDQLVLDGFKININLDEQPSAPPLKEKMLSTTKHRSLPSRVALQSLLLTNGQIILTHHQTEHAVFDHVRLEAWFPQSKQQHVPIQFKATLSHDSQTLPLHAELNYKGLVRLAPNTEEASNSLINRLELDGQLALQDIILKHYESTKANTHLIFNHKKLQLNPLTLSLYKGESIGQLSYQLDTKQLEFNQTGTSLNAEPVLRNLLGDTPPHVTGVLDYSMHASAYLDDPSWLKKSKLNGSITLRDGTLTYVSLKKITHEATQTIRHLATQNLNTIQETLEHLKPWNINDYSGSTPFSLINLQYKANNDGFLIYNLLLETKKLQLKGQGNLNLETNEVDAHLKANISTTDPITQTVQQLLAHDFPLKVSGQLDKLAIHVDPSAIYALLSHDMLSNHLTKPIKLIQHHLKKLQHNTHHSKETTSE